MTGRRIVGRPRLPSLPTDREIRVDVVATLVFTATTFAGVLGGAGLRIVAAVVSCVLFGVGMVVMGSAILRAIGRSRHEAISVADLFLVTEAPTDRRWWLHGALAAQVAVALLGASLRPYTPLAFGVLAPVFGLGVNGWWSATRATFPERHADGDESGR